MAFAIILNLVMKLIIILICIDTGLKEGKSKKWGWMTLAFLWFIQAVIVAVPGPTPEFIVYLYLIIGPLTIWVASSIRKLKFWSKLIEWSGAALIGAIFAIIILVI